MKRPFKSTRDVTPSQREKDKKRAGIALGKPLNGHPVHHHSRTQLVICENTAYHWLLHRRGEIVKGGGSPETHAMCYRCRMVLPFDDFIEHDDWIPTDPDRYRGKCRECERYENRDRPIHKRYGGTMAYYLFMIFITPRKREKMWAQLPIDEQRERRICPL